jgi:hypothetical protein
MVTTHEIVTLVFIRFTAIYFELTNNDKKLSKHYCDLHPLNSQPETAKQSP